MRKLASVGRLLLLALAVAFTVMTFAPMGSAANGTIVVAFNCKNDCGCYNGGESCCIAPSGAVCLDRGSVETF